MEVNLGLLPAQKDMLTCRPKKALMLGGIGTGKTRTLAMQALMWAVEYPKSKFMITANTYTQLINATVPAIVELLEELGIKYKLNKASADRKIEINGVLFYLYSLQNYESIRGIQVGGILADEVCFSKREAYDVIMGRLRDKRGPLKFRGFSSPNGYNWAYEEFGNFTSPKDKRRRLISAKTSDNMFLPDGYYEDLVEQYGGLENPLARQELLGEFVNLTAGAVYWAFDRSRHVKPIDKELMKRTMTYVGQDFNVDPMSSVYVSHFGGKYWVWQENILHDSNSYEGSQHLVKELSNQPFCLVPDSTGKARKSSSPRGNTDIEIFRQQGIHVLPTQNPMIRDRQNNANIKFKRDEIIIDPSCMTLIRELETLSNRDKEGEISHAAVALGYVLWKIDPIKKPKKQSYSSGR